MLNLKPDDAAKFIIMGVLKEKDFNTPKTITTGLVDAMNCYNGQKI